MESFANDTAETVFGLVSQFHYASHPLLPETRQELFLASIPALASKAFISRAGQLSKEKEGEFIRLLKLPGTTLHEFQRAARKALGLNPDHQMVSPLILQVKPAPSRCPAPRIEPGNSATPGVAQPPRSAAEKALLAGWFIAETCWRSTVKGA
jgi:hypothetical protein